MSLSRTPRIFEYIQIVAILPNLSISGSNTAVSAPKNQETQPDSNTMPFSIKGYLSQKIICRTESALVLLTKQPHPRYA